MATFRVYVTQYHSYEVEADDENEAERLGLEEFYADMRYPIANTSYDEVDVDVEELDEE